jgi:hypothetical protein
VRWLAALSAALLLCCLAAAADPQDFAARSVGASGALAALSASNSTAGPNAPAEITVTDKVLRPREKLPPLGANDWGGCGAVQWAANNFVHDSGNEPVYWRDLHRVMKCGPNWFEIDGPGTSWWDLRASGFLSGADLRIYRLVDKTGKSLPLNKEGNYLDVSAADHVVLVGKGRIVPEGQDNLPDGGWVCTVYGDVFPNAWIRHGNLRATDTQEPQNGRTYWYVVVGVTADGQETPFSNEVSATPDAGIANRPHLMQLPEDKPLEMKPAQRFEFAPRVVGGKLPLGWEVVEPARLPDGLTLDPTSGAISGSPKTAVEAMTLRLKVTDSAGRSDVRAWGVNPKPPATKAASKDKLLPPSDLKAIAANGLVTLYWKPSPSPGVVSYRLKRSTAPAARQEQRVYVTKDTPPLERFDYVVLQRRFGNFDMRYVHPRVRGIGNPADHPAWYWDGDLKKVSFSLVPHPQPVPAEMVDPGETCMQVKAAAGEQSIRQIVFIGTKIPKESLWYGQLEPGKSYHLEVWLRQEGLGNQGKVQFSYGRVYPQIAKTFTVDGTWKKYTYDFAGSERPKEVWHFGHQFTFTGPGTLWMDNCRISRCDRPEDAEKPYVPHAGVLEELLKTQPATGEKGTHRIWFLSRDATMSSILSWHASSMARPDWSTSVRCTMDMTLPQGLMFDLATGKDPQSRMKPWLVLQHVLHSEQDWLDLIEYLAAPYDLKLDTPQSKPWAYRRYQQRGVGTPWTDEFASIIIEFGNETWHNGHFEDWLGFHTRGAIWAGGKEYGLFSKYLIENMQNSPYWKSHDLQRKIRFCLGGGYGDANVDQSGKVTGYGELAMQVCPDATLLGHANYVGPKWETGDVAQKTFNDRGVQETLLGYVTDMEKIQFGMEKARIVLGKAGHNYDCGAYEGGPSGYTFGASPDEAEAQEKYGKSLAMAVAALDSWLGSYEKGWTFQNYLAYSEGVWWSSHTLFCDGFRPCPGWLAMSLRNRFAAGDMLAIRARSMPSIRRAKDVYPLIKCAAMRDGRRWSVFVLSRKLNAKYGDQDLGDGYTPVTLHLPFQRAGKITLHKLAGDPRLSNREKMNVEIRSQDVLAGALGDGTLAVNEQSGGGPGGMPPGSIYLYVFEATQ